MNIFNTKMLHVQTSFKPVIEAVLQDHNIALPLPWTNLLQFDNLSPRLHTFPSVWTNHNHNSFPKQVLFYSSLRNI